MTEQLVGHVTHWFNQASVAGIHVDRGELHSGDLIHIVGHTTDVEQAVGSMEIDHHHIEEARPGDEIGVKVVDHVRERDRVYRILN